MPFVTVKLYGALRDIVPKNLDGFDLPEGSTFKDLMVACVQRYGKTFETRLFYDDGSVRGYAKLFVNGEEVGTQDTPVPLIKEDGKSEVSVFIISTMAGG